SRTAPPHQRGRGHPPALRQPPGPFAARRRPARARPALRRRHAGLPRRGQRDQVPVVRDPIRSSASAPHSAPMTPTPADPSLLDRLPPELQALPFGSPEFKAMNAKLAQEDEDACAPVVRAMPTWINLTGTTVCNLKCFMCNQYLDPNSPKWFMSDEVYDRVVAELYPFARTVQFSAFGEPLMTPKMEQKLDDLIRTHTKLEIVTNATLMMKE